MNPEIEERDGALHCRICGRRLSRNESSRERHVSNDQRKIRLSLDRHWRGVTKKLHHRKAS